MQTKIMRVIPDVTLTLVGEPQRFMRVQYTLDDRTLHEVRVPAEGFTAEKARQAVEAEAAEIRKLLS